MTTWQRDSQSWMARMVTWVSTSRRLWIFDKLWNDWFVAGLVSALSSQLRHLDLGHHHPQQPNQQEQRQECLQDDGGISSVSLTGTASLPIAIPKQLPCGVSLHMKRPIFPNLPYSPLSSPSNVRRRPLKQSRHVSIEKTGQYIQLNQYLLKDPIGQVSLHPVDLLTSTDKSPTLGCSSNKFQNKFQLF